MAPAVGGCIARFDFDDGVRRWPVLRGSAEMPASPLDAASFPLVPFVNRIRGGRFAFPGRFVSLRPNMSGDPSPLHGQGWTARWHLTSCTADAAVLAFDHSAGEWPWDYAARQHLTLDARGLSLRLSCRNLSDAPMPCGLGQHPYFPCDAGTRIDTRVGHVWTIDEHVLPVARIPAAGRYDLADRPVCGQRLDHGFDGWNGHAAIRTPGAPFEIILSSSDAGFFQLYSPPAGGLFVAEPVTHANAALNAPEKEWAGLGLRVLAPGEEMTLDARIDVRPHDHVR